MNQKTQQEGQEIFDLKSLTKEEVGTFYRLCQGAVSSMREALKNCMTLEGTIEIG